MLIRLWGWSPHEWYQCPEKETPESSLTPFAQSGHRKKMTVYELGSRLSPDTKSVSISVLNSPASRTMRKQCLLLKLPSLWYSDRVAETD